MKWSPQQVEGIKVAGGWLMQCQSEMRAGRKTLSQPILRIFGYAGTGKTTIARHLAEGAKGETVYAAFTGKAALMMQRNGCHGASTIHSLIYDVQEGAHGAARFIWNPGSAAKDAALIVIDECSMVDEVLAHDLLKYRRPILVLGDPAQLPPVKGAGYFTEAHPDVMLTEIHRQARENPIIAMATTVREGGKLKIGTYGESRVVARGVLSEAEVLEADQVLVGKNATRHQFNAKMRRLKGRTDPLPTEGDRLVCLRNDKEKGIFNGGIFTVAEFLGADDERAEMDVLSEDFPKRKAVEVKTRIECWKGTLDDVPWQDLRGTQQFDYGYALTVHKAQGSQWGNVVLYDESGIFRDEAQRWLYTGLTRAAESVTVVTGGGAQ